MVRERRVFAYLFVVLLFLFFTLPVRGQYGQYGAPAPSQSILIEKTVSKPGSSDFVDNLSPSDPRFAPGQQITFRLKVKNTSNINLTNVTVKDFVPDFLQPVSGPGSFDSGSRSISFSAGDFAVNEEKTFFLTMKVVAQDQLPADKGIICEINKAQAFTDQVSDEDTAQFCIEKQVVGVTQVPTAGPELGLAILTFDAAILGAGFWLRKRTN